MLSTLVSCPVIVQLGGLPSSRSVQDAVKRRGRADTASRRGHVPPMHRNHSPVIQAQEQRAGRIHILGDAGEGGLSLTHANSSSQCYQPLAPGGVEGRTRRIPVGGQVGIAQIEPSQQIDKKQLARK